MKALSIKQPWVECILKHGKDIENRSWQPRKIVGKRIAIHASNVASSHKSFKWASQKAKHDIDPRDLPHGAICGTAVIAGYVVLNKVTGEVSHYGDVNPAFDTRISKWFVGPIGWVLRDVVPLARPIKCKGKLRLWDVPEELGEIPTEPYRIQCFRHIAEGDGLTVAPSIESMFFNSEDSLRIIQLWDSMNPLHRDKWLRLPVNNFADVARRMT